MDEKTRRHKIIVIACCIIASFALWIYTSSIQNPVIESKISNIPVEVINKDIVINSKYIASPEQKFTVSIIVKGPQSEVFGLKSSQFKIVADLSAYSAAYVVTKGINQVPIQVKEKPENINIKNSDDLKVNIKIDELMQKTVPVKVNVNGEPKEGFYKYNLKTDENTIAITGPQEYVNSIEFAQAKVDITNATSDVKFSAPLEAVTSDGKILRDETVKMKPSFVDGTIPISKVKSVDINISTKGNLSEKLILNGITSNIQKVNIIGKEDALSEITYLNTEDIDLSGITSKKEISVKLNVPHGIEILNKEESIKVYVDVERVVQKNLSKVIEIFGVGDKLEATIDNNKNVSMVITASESIINSLSEDAIKCYIDLADLQEGEYELPIYIKSPAKINILSSSPEKVKVNIKKKEVASEKPNKDKETSNNGGEGTAAKP